jgi:hypothetical protein
VPKDYFPEPTTADETLGPWDETAVAWLARSTTQSAKAIRLFLNQNLAQFSPERAKNLVGKLTWDWQSYLFEVIVGRYLQVLGADVEPEPRGKNGTHIDYQATFPDGVIVSVECISKRFNKAANATIEREGKMSQMLDEVGPIHWAIDVQQLPKANSGVEFEPYVKQAQIFYSTLPEPTDNDQRVHFAWEGEVGTMELEALPFPRGTKANHIGPVVTWMDDSIQRLKYALKDTQKRRQALGARPPVFLAIDCPFGGPDAEDLEQALFGQTVDHRDFDPHVSVGTSFDPNGLLVTDKGIPFAGVLAFIRLTMAGGAEPVLYLNPYQRWKLPEALASHETRVWTSTIERKPATRQPTLNTIAFVDTSMFD